MGCGNSKPKQGAVTAPASKQQDGTSPAAPATPSPNETVRLDSPSAPLLPDGGKQEEAPRSTAAAPNGDSTGDIEMGTAAAQNEASTTKEAPKAEAPAEKISPARADEKDQLLEAPISGEKREMQISAPEEAKAPEAASPVRSYFSKFAGAGVAGPPRPPLKQTGFSFMGSFIGIAVLGLIHIHLVQLKDPHHFVMLIGPFGAMAVLVFSACKAPLAQPRNAIMGNTIGGLCGWLIVKAMELTPLGSFPWTASALSVALTIVIQERMGAVHPPGGATALTYVIVLPLHALDYLYILCPAFMGSLVLVCIGLFTNNLSQARAYPQGWGFETDATAKPSEGEAGSPVKAYFRKFAGAGVVSPPNPPLTQSGFSFMGSFLGIATLAVIDAYVFPKIPVVHMKLIIGSFGAMAVLVFSACKAPLAQPKNAVLGNSIGGVVGVTVFEIMRLAGVATLPWLWLMGALAVSLTIVIQELTSSVHPPGGATALIFVTIPLVQPLGYVYVLSPACLGAVLLVGVGLLTNNLSQVRTYPQGWW